MALIKKMHSKKILISVGLVVILLVAGAMSVLGKKGVIDLLNNNPSHEAENKEVINYGPPTVNEKRAGDEQKDKIVGENTPSQDNGQSKRNASVIITDAGLYDATVEVRAFIPDHYQDGSCTITLVKGGLTVSKSTPAYRDVSTTICTNPLFNRSEFAEAGEWQVTVSYASDNAKGASETKLITIK